MEIDKKELKKILTEQRKEYEQYIGTLKEDFDHKLEAIHEAVQTVPEIKRVVDLTFEKVGEITVDLEVTKEVVKDHEQRLQKIEA